MTDLTSSKDPRTTVCPVEINIGGQMIEKSMHTDMSVDQLVAHAIAYVFDPAFDRFELKLTETEKLSIVAAINYLQDRPAFMTYGQVFDAIQNVTDVRKVIERQIEAEQASPLPSYDTFPASVELDAIIGELAYRHIVHMNRIWKIEMERSRSARMTEHTVEVDETPSGFVPRIVPIQEAA